MSEHEIFTRTAIYVRSGIAVELSDPENADIRLSDIVGALASINRYTGHGGAVGRHYSVAAHTLNLLALAPHGATAEEMLYLALHDASEAYLGDVSGPLKHLLPDYRALEAQWQKAIYEHFGLDNFSPPDWIHRLDKDIVFSEMRMLFGRAVPENAPAFDLSWPGGDPPREAAALRFLIESFLQALI